MKRLIIDLDNTLTLTFAKGGERDYSKAMPHLEAIQKVRVYKEEGFSIVIFTSRNMRTYNNSVGHINAHTTPKIIEWLKKYDVPFDEIHVGKPWCGDQGFYVDDKAIRPDEFINLSYKEIRLLIGAEE